ncbi:MAG TPA: type VI secretion system contractile sheath small subunit [Verrucomicrobiae bacterium]|jgi:type VI secretion system protein ImpB|nr:type VI secretion system contractile sheath small subunit [Verrucomicrobiae bacterium]
MGKPSGQKKISVKPRVQISYDVDTGDATELKEIPFVMGVMADLSGDNAGELPEIADRKFSEVDGYTFDKYLKSQKPRATFEVDNTLTGEGKLKVDMNFESMDDFSPAAVARKVDGLKQLFEAREELSSLLTTVGSKPKLEKALESLVKNPELAKHLQAQIHDGESKNT